MSDDDHDHVEDNDHNHDNVILTLGHRGPGKAPALLSGGDCSAVSQFIPGKDLQEVNMNPNPNH